MYLPREGKRKWTTTKPSGQGTSDVVAITMVFDDNCAIRRSKYLAFVVKFYIKVLFGGRIVVDRGEF